MKKFTQTLIVAFLAIALFSTANGQATYYNVTPGVGYGLRFWSSDFYKIHMGNTANYKYGPVQDYSIKMNMNNDSDRGWTWGVLSAPPIAALNTQGTFQLAKDLKVMGNTGLGTTSPNSKLHVNANSTQTGLRVQISGNSKLTVASNGGTTIGTFNNTPPANGLYVDGNVGLGCTNPLVKLAVNGKIKATGLELTTAPCSDFVFEPDYELIDLNELEDFVTSNKHLPEVPSAQEFSEDGYNIRDMDDILLRKVEELTLYIIKQQKEIDMLKSKIK